MIHLPSLAQVAALPLIWALDLFARRGDDQLADCAICGDASTHRHIKIGDSE